MGRRGIAVDVTRDVVGSPVQLQRPVADSSQLPPVEMLDFYEHEDLLLIPTDRLHAYYAGARGMVFELIAVLRLFERVPLPDYQHVVETPRWNTGPLTPVDHFGAVGEIDFGRLSLRITVRSNLRLRLHQDPRLGVLPAGKPGIGSDELAVFVLLRVFAQVPDDAVSVLSMESYLRLDQLAVADVLLEDDRGHNVVDHLDQISDRGDLAVRAVVGHPPQNKLRPGDQR